MNRCPVCSNEHGRFFATLDDQKFYRCMSCASIYLSTPKTPLSGHETYTAEYISQRGHDGVDTPLAAGKQATARYYLSKLEQHAQTGRLLEVGCSTGLALRVAKDRGWSVQGVEINEAAVAIAREALGKEAVLAGELQDSMFSDDFFNAAVLFDVIEHIPEPGPFMAVLAKKIRKGGTVLFVTPNAASISAALLRSRWPHLMLEHLVIYSPRAIRDFLARHGFDVLKSRWAVKFVTTETIRRHLLCHPNTFCAAPAARLLHILRFLDRLLLPVNIGEMYVIARKR